MSIIFDCISILYLLQIFIFSLLVFFSLASVLNKSSSNGNWISTLSFLYCTTITRTSRGKGGTTNLFYSFLDMYLSASYFRLNCSEVLCFLKLFPKNQFCWSHFQYYADKPLPNPIFPDYPHFELEHQQLCFIDRVA